MAGAVHRPACTSARVCGPQASSLPTPAEAPCARL